MTTPISPPARKNPQKRTRVPVVPPDTRSRAALGLSVAAARGRFMLQVCTECSAILYPPRDACSSCLSVDLEWQVVSNRGRLVAETVIRTSAHVYFRDRTPWRVGTVQLDCGPSMICHVHGDCESQGNVRMINRLDKSGHGVLFALPEKEIPAMEDDPQLRELTCSPKFRRILITDARSESGQALATAFSRANAALVFAGEAERWRHWPERDSLKEIDNVELVPLDVSDTQSVEELCGEIGGKVDILVNNARFVRPGRNGRGRPGIRTTGNGGELSGVDAPCPGFWSGNARARCRWCQQCDRLGEYPVDLCLLQPTAVWRLFGLQRGSAFAFTVSAIGNAYRWCAGDECLYWPDRRRMAPAVAATESYGVETRQCGGRRPAGWA